ncbi:MAG: response regulator [Candidatus Riflebacteria bacterium]|nr:response regulator [Candidatus Riflebacteria bacterium]
MAKLLIIDDEELIRRRLEKLLQLDDYETFCAEDGPKGLALFQQVNPDMALVDIKMPGMDGIEVLKKIKELSKSTEVIMMTGHGGTETVIDALRAGAFDYIAKPIEYDELEISIKRALEKQGMMKKLEEYTVSLEKELTERKKVEERLAASLAAREILLQEVHHRVKNNLQIIAGLLNMESRHITDEAAKKAFENTRSRIDAIAFVHNKLHTSTDLAHVNMADYVKSLAAQLQTSYGKEERKVTLKLEVSEEVEFNLEISVPLGLLFNEIITNAIKHAFPDNREGEIKISLIPDGSGNLVFTVKDNGVGIPPEKVKSGSTGTKLINMLARQLGGTLIVENDSGTRTQITFKDPKMRVNPVAPVAAIPTNMIK